MITSKVLTEKIRVIQKVGQKSEVVSVELVLDYSHPTKQVLIKPSGHQDNFVFQMKTGNKASTESTLNTWIAVADAIKDAVALARLKLEEERKISEANEVTG
jgi:hypothetical protein